jgi:hypothetical protein
MTGDCHVRLREGLRGKFPWSTRLYDMNFKPKIFTDITKPAKQSFSPNIGITTYHPHIFTEKHPCKLQM